MKKSLAEKYQDATLRYIFPLQTSQVKILSDGSQVIVKLTTSHGFEVCFGTKPETCQSLGTALRESPEQEAETGALLVN